MKIGWYYLNVNNLNIQAVPPEPAFKSVAREFPNSEIPICPAVGNYFKNTWVIRCPVDLDLDCDLEHNKITIVGPKTPDELALVTNRKDHDQDILSLALRYIFVSDESVILESIPAFMYTSEVQTKLRFIPGSFDIHRWIRPVDFSAQILQSGRIKINQGDPLFYIRIVTDENVELINIADRNKQKDLWDIIVKCTKYKFECPRKSLKNLYIVAENWIASRQWL